MFWNAIWKAVGPFDHRDTFAEKVIFQTEARDRLSIFQAKKIEVINRQTSARIFVNDRESGACHNYVASQPGYEAFHKLRFARAEIAFQGKDRSRAESVRKALGEFLRLRRAI